ncbi:CCA tRNA nucleotidyltransferase [Sporosarcina limicola]|uniref:tRNA nucleotidyltransferase (CCA-adding enzyme) n=1 Tax=Sporosarcina limicola TaxID=34101 RepID=A0A927R3U4_9BACL|nr:CCA tRNA nucleotidyltransferase [Sporosarcina limicola]MBE1554133.1 tRNA nucleotidyltransferase (CCA-adding enzyme) [Sporosarcina limicola]
MTNSFGTGPSREVIRCLEAAGYEAVFVGGAVRDYVLGKPATDMDIATSAQPDEVKVVFSNTVDLGTEHGTVLVLMQREPIEVTTYRTEGTYTDHRRPDEVQFVKSLREDLLRRDFTMNALAMTKEGELIDLFGGKQDIAHQIIKAVGNPANRFKEDALRMFRAVRFASVLGFAIEEDTYKAIAENAQQIRYISIERLKAEMDKLFNGIDPEKAFRYIQDSGLGIHLPLFPIKAARLISTVPYESAVEGWACFMVAGNFSPTDVMKAYKLSKHEQMVITAVNEAYEKRRFQPFSIGDYYTYDLQVLFTAEKLFQAYHADKEKISNTEIMHRKQSLPIQSVKDLKVDGKVLISWTGLKGGPWTGKWIGLIEHAVLHGRCDNDSNTIKEWFLHEFNREK